MATRRNQIVERITDLEEVIRKSSEEIDTLKNELTTTPGDLLDRDPDGQIEAEFRAYVEHARRKGMIPKQ